MIVTCKRDFHFSQFLLLFIIIIFFLTEKYKGLNKYFTKYENYLHIVSHENDCYTMWSTRNQMKYESLVKYEKNDIVNTIRETLALPRDNQKNSSSSASNNWDKLMSLVKKRKLQKAKAKWDMEK